MLAFTFQTHTHTHSSIRSPTGGQHVKAFKFLALAPRLYTEESQAHPIKQSVFVRLLTTDGCFSHYQILYIPPNGKHLPVPAHPNTYTSWNTSVWWVRDTWCDNCGSECANVSLVSNTAKPHCRSQVRNSWKQVVTSVSRVKHTHLLSLSRLWVFLRVCMTAH